MRRWNGWGDDGVSVSLPPSAAVFLEELLGAGTPPRDTVLADAVAAVPPARHPPHPLISADAELRVRRARGQSLPDWVALRSGRIAVFPDGVACPETEDDVQALLGYARRTGARLIPYGGGTSVVGHVNPLPGEAPVVTIDLSRMSALHELDVKSQLATFGAGILGPDLEAHLRASRFTLGHFPQSFEFSTLGGWVAARSSGQQSLGYGRIERLFAGGRLETPAGRLDLPPFPASAAGPDLREVVLGSEGRLGVLTRATVRVAPLPPCEEFFAVFFGDWGSAVDAAREIAQARLPLSMLRLSNPNETETTLALAGGDWRVSALRLLVTIGGAGAGRCLLLAGATGSESLVRHTRWEVRGLARRRGGVYAGHSLGRAWKRKRFLGPYLRNALWERGYAVDTLETAAPWSKLLELHDAVEAALAGALAGGGEKVHVFTHVSHVYPSGSSLYTTYVFRITPDPDETLRRWKLLKGAASRAIVAGGGTISHQHGVGLDHRDYLVDEKGRLGLDALGDLLESFDPDGLMNPGKLLP